jgi:response regulator RpfG family c-di-GMP phosphodiesterase
MMIRNNPISALVLLYVDDGRDDVVLIEAAIRMAAIPFSLRAFATISAAAAHLKGEGSFADRSSHPFPDLALFDYHLAGGTAAEALPELRKLPGCSSVPFIVFSGSESAERILNSYQAGADHFLLKPSGLQRLELIVKTLYDCATSTPPCYLALCELPEYQSLLIPASEDLQAAA